MLISSALGAKFIFVFFPSPLRGSVSSAGRHLVCLKAFVLVLLICKKPENKFPERIPA